MANRPDNVVPITTQARSVAEKFGAEHDRELLTILFTDLVDSTQLQSELGNAEAARLTELHRKIVREELEKYDAREIEWAGDSCLAVFTKPSDGVAFALKLQGALREARQQEPRMPLVRIGLHLGEIVVRHHDDGGKRTEDLFGLQVSEAARVMSLARGDQIYCTRAVFENARSSLKGRSIDGVADVQWREHGNFELKGSENLVDVCEVGDAAHAPLEPPESNEKCRPYRGDPAKWRERRARAGQPRRGIPAATLIPVVVLSAIGGAALMWLAYAPAPASDAERRLAGSTPVRFVVELPEDAPLAGRESSGSELAISPDGRTVVYVALEKGSSRLYRRDLDSLEPPRPIPGTEGGREPRFSSDDRTLLFTKRNPHVFLSLALEGGAPVVLAERDTGISGQLAVLPDGSLVYSKAYGTGLLLGRRGSREPETLTTVDRTRNELAHMDPEMLPGGDAFLFFATVGSGTEQNRVEAFSMRSRERKVLIHGGTQARYSPTGHILYASAGKLMAAPFDASSLEVTGPPFLVLSSIVTRIGGLADFDLSEDGTLVYVPAESSTSGSILAWVNLDGSIEPIPAGTRVFRDPAISPDGRHVAVAVGEGGVFDLWLFDVARGAWQRDPSHLASGWGPDRVRTGIRRPEPRGDERFRLEPEGRAEAEPG
jgi:class 3 adenylate cyclase